MLEVVKDSERAEAQNTNQEMHNMNGQAHNTNAEPVIANEEPVSEISQEMGLDEPLSPLHTPHRRRKVIMWLGLTLLTMDLCYLPITYYYALKFGTNMKLQDIFAVITAVYGMISFAHYFFRSLKLFLAKKAPRWRPVGWTRWGVFEFLHINFISAISIVEVELIVGTIPEDPIVRLLAMPSPTICYWFGIVFILSAILTQQGKILPFNMSSTPKGSPWRPALLALIEDAGGVEGQGGVVYRSNVIKRYKVSPIFRRMVLWLTWAWGVGLLGIAITSTVVIMSVGEDVGFGIGWGLPFVFSTMSVALTMIFVRSQLRKEKAHWQTKQRVEGPNND